jgi:hypothetical protein
MDKDLATLQTNTTILPSIAQAVMGVVYSLNGRETFDTASYRNEAKLHSVGVFSSPQ